MSNHTAVYGAAALEAVRAEIERIDTNTVRRPVAPVAVILDEARNLTVAVREDIIAFESVGVGIDALDRIATAANALSYAQSLLGASMAGREGAQKEWELAFPRALELRETLRRNLKFVLKGTFIDRDGKLNSKKRAKNGALLVQDMFDLCAIAAENPQCYLWQTWDKSRTEETLELATRLGTVLAKARSLTAIPQAIETRNRAFTYLWEQMAALRATGRYVLRNNASRARLYASTYRRRSKSASFAA